MNLWVKILGSYAVMEKWHGSDTYPFVIRAGLDNDHKSPGDYDKVKNQEQLWKNTEERAHRNKNKGEKDLIYKNIKNWLKIN